MLTEVFTDGSYRKLGSAAAVVIYQNGKEVFRTVKPVVANNSMIAESEAIILAVNLCYIANFPKPTIYTDSQVLFEQFYRKKNVNSLNVFPFISTLWQMEKVYAFSLQFVKRDKVYIPHDICHKFILEQHEMYKERTRV